MVVFDWRWWLVIWQWVWISMVGCGSVGVEILLIFLGLWYNNAVFVVWLVIYELLWFGGGGDGGFLVVGLSFSGNWWVVDGVGGVVGGGGGDC